MSKSTEAMKKAITTTEKAETLLKEAQKETQAAVKTLGAQATNKPTTPAKTAAKPSTKPVAKPQVKTLTKRPSLRESVKKAQATVAHKAAKAKTESPEVTIKVEVNTITPPWEAGSTVVSVSTPKLPETTLVNQTMPVRAKQPSSFAVEDNVRSAGTKSTRPTEYAGFGTVGRGFSKN